MGNPLSEYGEFEARSRCNAAMGWITWQAETHRPIGPMPMFPEEDKETAWISQRLAGHEAVHGSRVWTYREVHKDYARRELPHEQKRARLAAGIAMVTSGVAFATVLAGFFLPAPAYAIWGILALNGALFVLFAFEYAFWAPKHSMQFRIAQFASALLVASLMWPLAKFIWWHSVPNAAPLATAKPAEIRQNGERQQRLTNGAVREPSKAPVLNRKERDPKGRASAGGRP